MRSLHCLIIWRFFSTILTGADPPCHMVRQSCEQDEPANVPWCIERQMRKCSIIQHRISNQGYFLKTISSLEPTLYTKEGYVIHISTEALQKSSDVQREINDTETNLIVYVVNNTFFRTQEPSDTESKPKVHGESVLGVWLGEKEVCNLSQPVQLQFRRSNQSENGICVYWHLSEFGGGTWRTDGCNTSIESREFVCSCNHLSFFAVLINPQIPEEAQIVHLEYISYTGSVLSIVFTAIIMIMFLLRRKKRCDHSVIIHVELTGSLFLLHISFLCSVWFSSQRDEVCQFLGLVLHWCLLATFTWTAIEGFHLYLLLVRVFNIYIKRYLLKLSLVGWGVPTVTVMICGVTKVYGKYTFSMKRHNSTGTPMCWITTQTVSYVTVNAYLGLVLLFNIAILAMLVVKMHQLRSRDLHIKNNERRVWKDWASLLGLSCILGVAWGLAFFTHGGPLSIPSLYVFSILNCFQEEVEACVKEAPQNGICDHIWYSYKSIFWHQNLKTLRVILHKGSGSHNKLAPNVGHWKGAEWKPQRAIWTSNSNSGHLKKVSLFSCGF
ncbi:adhesion G-protein coupled receptor G5-like isoform X3 [Myxocyprinus asiaticus]|uniref:adhesion G-protein coupled receptor G5-like isoform X3 n=1 Tax=Myxocyprinus asiaticus TaxID=70543 RepID=UPI002221B6D9|nr:adhesion G-protein coupled receptor G5-like isoform X3 [Myxocyprinus asiaticus]